MAIESPPYDATKEYTIRIPGIQDVIVIPPLESADLKKERVRRWQAYNSPLPDWLRMVPEWIHFLDDAQDVLIVSLLLGRIIAKPILMRMVPVLGWLLLGNDVLNLFTQVLSLATQPRIAKTNFLRLSRQIVAGRRGRLSLAHRFLTNRFPFVPFIIQGGQVLESYTGWGLRLGGVMGAITDAWWGFLRTIGGDSVRIIGPPPSDYAMKCARLVQQADILGTGVAHLNRDEASMLALALAHAIGYLREQFSPGILEERLSILAGTRRPTNIPWSESSVDALIAGDWDRAFERARPALPTDSAVITLADGMKVSISAQPNVDIELQQKFAEQPSRFPLGLFVGDAAIGSWEVFMDGVDRLIPDLSPMERLMAISIESGIVPPWMAKWGPPYDPGPRWDFPVFRGGPQLIKPPGWFPETNAPPYRMKPPFPPARDNPITHLVHWLRMQLAILCRRKVVTDPFVFYESDTPIRLLTEISSLGNFTLVPYWASLLTWGNVFYATKPNWEPNPGNPQHVTHWCRIAEDGYPTLSGGPFDDFQLYDNYEPWPEIGRDDYRDDILHLDRQNLPYTQGWFDRWIAEHPWPYYRSRPEGV